MGADPSMREELIRRARVLFIDGYGLEGSLRAARIARDAEVPIVADFESARDVRLNPLLELVDHLIVPASFAQEWTGAANVEESLRMLWNDSRQVVAVTAGSEGCWAMASGLAEAVHIPAHPVKVVDTLGCGDVFHGAYAAALVFGYSVLGAIRFANVAAGLKAARLGTREGLPTRAEIEVLLPIGDRRG